MWVPGTAHSFPSNLTPSSQTPVLLLPSTALKKVSLFVAGSLMGVSSIPHLCDMPSPPVSLSAPSTEALSFPTLLPAVFCLDIAAVPVSAAGAGWEGRLRSTLWPWPLSLQHWQQQALVCAAQFALSLPAPHAPPHQPGPAQGPSPGRQASLPLHNASPCSPLSRPSFRGMSGNRLHFLLEFYYILPYK